MENKNELPWVVEEQKEPLLIQMAKWFKYGLPKVKTDEWR